MRLLLDTHALVWWCDDNPALSDDARAAIAHPRNEVFVSPVSTYEVAFKQSIGKLAIEGDLMAAIERSRFQSLAISVEHGFRAGCLPLHHRDPFDRLLIAQALTESLLMVTRDQHISAYGVPVLPA